MAIRDKELRAWIRFMAALVAHEGNIRRAALSCGMPYGTAYSRAKKIREEMARVFPRWRARLGKRKRLRPHTDGSYHAEG